MAESAPDRIIDAEGVVFETPNPTHRSKTADEAPFLNVLLTDGPAAKLADRSRFLFALDAFHISAAAASRFMFAVKQRAPALAKPNCFPITGLLPAPCSARHFE
jgi:hypothetical protein